MASEDIYGLLGLLGGLGGSYFMNQNNANKDAADALLSKEARQQQFDNDKELIQFQNNINQQNIIDAEKRKALALANAPKAPSGMLGELGAAVGGLGASFSDILNDLNFMSYEDQLAAGNAVADGIGPSKTGAALSDILDTTGGLSYEDQLAAGNAVADGISPDITGKALSDILDTTGGMSYEDQAGILTPKGDELLKDAMGFIENPIDTLKSLFEGQGSQFSNMEMDDGSRKKLLEAMLGKSISEGSMMDKEGNIIADPFQTSFESPILDPATAEMLGFNDMEMLYDDMRKNAPVTQGEFSNTGMPEGEYTVGMNEGGRVGLANGGNPYAGLKYGFVNNIFTPTGGTNIAPPVSGPGYGFQDFVTPPDETASGTPNVTNPNAYNPMYGGGPGDGAANYQSQMGTDVFGNEIGGPKNPFGFGPQAMYGTDIDGTPFEDGKYRSFTGEGPIDIDDDDYGARFFDFLSGVPNITTGYGIFDYFSADAREERKAEAEADKAAAEAAAAAAAAAAIEQEKYNLAQLENHPLGDGGLGTGPIGPAPSTLGLISEDQRKAGGGGGYQGSSKKGDSKGFGNNRDFGGGGVD